MRQIDTEKKIIECSDSQKFSLVELHLKFIQMEFLWLCKRPRYDFPFKHEPYYMAHLACGVPIL